jgi:peptidoglycan pentaglycine glycine transferase (the first glycine)
MLALAMLALGWQEAAIDGPGVDAGISVSTSRLDPEWDAFVDRAPGGHHLQTSLWANVKATQGWRPIRTRLQRDGELVGGFQLLLHSLPVGTIAYCPRGPVMADLDQTALGIVLDALASVALRHRILYVKVQPPAGRGDIEHALRERGFAISDLPTAPVATVMVDVRRTPEELLAGMRANSRRCARKAIRDRIEVRPAGDTGLAAFARIIARASERHGYDPYPVDYYAEILRQFGPRAELLLAERGGEALSGLLLIGYGDSVICKACAWSGEHRGIITPNELIHWRAMQWARDHGYRYYDLEGIEESVARAILAGEGVPERGRRTATHFKLGLGGEVTVFPRSYDRSFHRLLAWPARLVAPRLSRMQSRAHRLQGRVPLR